MLSSTINNPLASTINRPIAISIGEVAGIGPEIILKSWIVRQEEDLPVFFVVGNIQILTKTARSLGLDIPLHSIDNPDKACEVFHDSLPIFDIANVEEFTLGHPSAATANLTITAIKKSVELILAHQAAALITAPIQKSILYQVGFNSPGHTEFLAELCACVEKPAMMLVSNQLRVVPLTIHMALADVPQAITPELIRATCVTINQALKKDFSLKNPRIMVAGLNPHAGENGTMGQEEQQIITPALDQLRAEGCNIQGPYPADTLFHASARAKYDAVLCMYHDQALIPLKTLDFDGGVNVTLGLPIVRTSPDHGTALDIAGQNLANPTSMINAIKLAAQIYENRQNA